MSIGRTATRGRQFGGAPAVVVAPPSCCRRSSRPLSTGAVTAAGGARGERQHRVRGRAVGRYAHLARDGSRALLAMHVDGPQEGDTSNPRPRDRGVLCLYVLTLQPAAVAAASIISPPNGCGSTERIAQMVGLSSRTWSAAPQLAAPLLRAIALCKIWTTPVGMDASDLERIDCCAARAIETGPHFGPIRHFAANRHSCRYRLA